MASKRKKKHARTVLFETIQAGTLKAFAPTFLETEMKKKIPEISEKENISEELLNFKWERYKQTIEFIDVGEPESDGNERDPKDVPYLKLSEAINASILSKDKDIEGMGGDIFPFQIVPELRDYSRAAAINYSVIYSGVVIFDISSEAIMKIKEFINIIFTEYRDVSVWSIIIFTVVLTFLISIPSTRNWLSEKFTGLGHKYRSVWDSLLQVLEKPIEQILRNQVLINDVMGKTKF